MSQSILYIYNKNYLLTIFTIIYKRKYQHYSCFHYFIFNSAIYPSFQNHLFTIYFIIIHIYIPRQLYLYNRFKIRYRLSIQYIIFFNDTVITNTNKINFKAIKNHSKLHKGFKLLNGSDIELLSYILINFEETTTTQISKTIKSIIISIKLRNLPIQTIYYLYTLLFLLYIKFILLFTI